MTIRGLPPSVRVFARAVGWGSLAGASPLLLISIPVGIGTLFPANSGSEWWSGIFVVFVPLLVVVPIVLAASVVFGLPLTAWLSRTGVERGQHYVTAGLLLGAIPLFILFNEIMVLAALLSFGGTLGGGVTGWVWGRYRDDLAAKQTPE